MDVLCGQQIRSKGTCSCLTMVRSRKTFLRNEKEVELQTASVTHDKTRRGRHL